MKVKLKSYEGFKKLLREGKIELLHCSDSGEIYHYGIPNVNPSPVLSVWYDDYGEEHEVVDHHRPISKPEYEQRKIFFDLIDDDPTE